MAEPFPFLHLPLELRERVYSYYFHPADRLETLEYNYGSSNTGEDGEEIEGSGGSGGGRYKFEFRLLRVCKQVCEEARKVWRRENIFVKVETPWPTAVYHISSEGNVPIVALRSKPDGTIPEFTSHRALVSSIPFIAHHAQVTIAAPFHQARPEHTIILLLEDLHLFAKVWYYSALSYPHLNAHLCTTFAVRDPYDAKDPSPASRALQQSVLKPFGLIKELYEMDFEGFDEDLVRELKKEMATPAPSLQECCEEASTLMEEGDRVLAENEPREALELYRRAFFAIHIIIEGRERRVVADNFFHEGITEGRYQGQIGATVRVILRILLVSRTVLAYLRLHEFGEAAFWGMRSIRIMRDAQDTEFEDFLAEFVGSGDVGLINARTAIAFAVMEKDIEDGEGKWKEEVESYRGEDIADSAVLWRMAEKYLKGVGRESERKRVMGEAKGFGVSVPEVLFGRADVEVDSMSHLHLNGVDGEGLGHNGIANGHV